VRVPWSTPVGCHRKGAPTMDKRPSALKVRVFLLRNARSFLLASVEPCVPEPRRPQAITYASCFGLPLRFRSCMTSPPLRFQESRSRALNRVLPPTALPMILLRTQLDRSLGEAPILLVMSPKMTPRNITELIAEAKKQPDKWFFATSARGTRTSGDDRFQSPIGRESYQTRIPAGLSLE
jgi:hypothetical protein